MHTGRGRIVELTLRDGVRRAAISCAAVLIPDPGQFVLTGIASFAQPLPDPVYYTDSRPDGFLAAPVPEIWSPGLEIHLRGPLGHGFSMPESAKRIALVPLAGTTVRLRPLIALALKRGAAVVWVGELRMDDLPDEVEVQPMSALEEVAAWADWMALDVERGAMEELRERIVRMQSLPVWRETEILIHTFMPCGSLADCGVCAVTTKTGWKMACRDGPVFSWGEI